MNARRRQTPLWASLLVLLGLRPLVHAMEGADSARLAETAARLRATVEEIARPDRHWLDTAALDRTAAAIRGRLEGFGLPCTEQVFEIQGRRYRNVECVIQGKKKDILVIGAHYDVAGRQPGADDNASGIAGLVEIARRFSLGKAKPRSTIRLVAYTLEEPPFYGTEDMGSFRHARAMKDSALPVQAMISLEMIGCFGDSIPQSYPPGVPEGVYPERGNFAAAVSDLGSAGLVRRFQAVADKVGTIPVLPYAAASGVGWSDHMNYWKHGFPAFMITDTAFLRNLAYHSASDTPETLDYAAMAKLLDIVHRFAAEF